MASTVKFFGVLLFTSSGKFKLSLFFARGHAIILTKPLNGAVTVLYRLIPLYPEAIALFNQVNGEHPNSAEFRAHLMRAANGIDSMIQLLDDPPVLSKEIKHRANQHAAIKGMKSVYFTVNLIDPYNTL